ncbi:Zn-dependent M28 family amino/carboxypeptidase [Sphingomonas sp. SORGH_AS802]|uniref:M20/M25/M40 family metallo-hydrolase n=1 Tax=unclassified Sphingomonas TaxID=196159 RepID=UPI00285FB6FF|nr:MULTISPECIES: M20/M25/M40 family metallo-hydrolase [unclassified Sphingomonas]MDR6127155.1 Zn-dependent M28 family amino/carboxypeptidase [Sphingomonas sp. SORGH_AS_0438]MDR6133925.1 Zn-dependent M28 family amino/carboxypeptidase [Sphingomonas sp. SORGH_AS_0802]
MKTAALVLLLASSPLAAQRPAAPPPGGPTTATRPRPTPLPVPPDPKAAALRDKALTDDTAYALVEGLTTEVGPRMTGGSARQAYARDWAVARLKALGFKNVRIEPYTLNNVWERGAETAEIVGLYAQPLHITALGNTGATPAEGLTAPVVYFATFNDLLLAPAGSLAGKIAFVSNAMEPTQDGSSYGSSGSARFVGPNVAAQKGAAALVIRSIGTDHGRGPHAGTTNFDAGVTPIPAGALSVADAENLERMIKLGKPVTMKLTLTPRFVGDRQSGNVVAEVPGTDPKAGIVLVGGHLDSWDLGTGAIDDASGVAITAAAAKLVMDAGRPRRTIRVVWFGDEEIGGFGGEAYAKAHSNEYHATASESDFGADRVWRFETNFDPAAKPIADRLAVTLAPLGIVRGSGTAGDGTDIAPVVKTGVAGVDLNQSGLRYFDYHHTPEDTLDRVDPAQLRQNVAAWTAMLQIVANAPETIAPVTPRR